MNDRSKKEAEILRNRRKELGLTQMETAMKAGIVLQQYQRFDPYSFVNDSGDMSDTDK